MSREMNHMDAKEDSTDTEGVERILDQSSSTLDGDSSLYEDDEDLLPCDPVLLAGPGQGLLDPVLLAGPDQGLLDPVLLAGPGQGLLDPVLLAGPDQGLLTGASQGCRGRRVHVSLVTFLQDVELQL
jgi:hypothetical protein